MRLKSLVGSSGGPLFFLAVRRVCLKRRAVIATGSSGMQALATPTKEAGRGKAKGGKRRRVKPECHQADHIMSPGLYDLLITK